MLGYPPTPPPPPRGALWLTARPADPQGLGQPRGGGDNTQNGCTPFGVTHWLAAPPVTVGEAQGVLVAMCLMGMLRLVLH